MQVDPIKPTLEAPGTKHLKLQCDEPFSSFAFKFNMRHNIEVDIDDAAQAVTLEVGPDLGDFPGFWKSLWVELPQFPS